MKKNIVFSVRIIAFVIAALLLSVGVFANYPKADNYVADEAGVLAESTVRSIAKSNETMKKDYGAVVAVCTVKTTGDTPISEYARGVFTSWKIGGGVLILIAADDMDYYIVQSVALEDIITNEQLQLVRNDYLEPDFAQGNIDRAVTKSVTKLTSIIQREIAKKAEEAKENSENEEENSTSHAIVTFFKVILYGALAIVVIFVALFIASIWSDTAMVILQNTVFKKKKPRYQIPDNYYDERLYGVKTTDRPRRRPDDARDYRRDDVRRDNVRRDDVRRPRPQEVMDRERNRMRDEYVNQRQNRADVYYNADGTVRRARGAENRTNEPRRVSDDATQMFSVPKNNRRY